MHTYVNIFISAGSKYIILVVKNLVHCKIQLHVYTCIYSTYVCAYIHISNDIIKYTISMQIEITYHVSWRRTFSGGRCDSSNVGSTLRGGSTLSCLSGCSGSITSMSYICTDFSIDENWSFGERRLNLDFSSYRDRTLRIGDHRILLDITIWMCLECRNKFLYGNQS